MAKGRDGFRLSSASSRRESGALHNKPQGTTPFPPVSASSQLLLPGRARPSRSFLRHPPDLASESQTPVPRPPFAAPRPLPAALGIGGSNRAILQAMLPPGGVSRRCASLWSGARKPQAQAGLRGQILFPSLPAGSWNQAAIKDDWLGNPRAWELRILLALL